jgi:glucose/mannose-6-phosphate isomerase
MLIVLEKLSIIKPLEELHELISTLKELRDVLTPDVPDEENPAKQLAQRLAEGIPFIYGHTYLNIIARRWQTQLNENSKMVAMSGGFPEMNHNEIVGWAEDEDGTTSQFVVILLRSADEHPRITKRMELTKEVLFSKAKSVLEVDAPGTSRLSRMISAMYLGDYTSVYLALQKDVDPTPVVSIEELKRMMIE